MSLLYDVLDYVSMGLIAVRLTSNVIHNASYILVFELICGLQSADQRSGKSGKGGVTELNPASSGVCEQARELVFCNDYDVSPAPIESVEEFKICCLAALLSVRNDKGFDW